MTNTQKEKNNGNRTELKVLFEDDGFRAALNALALRNGVWTFGPRQWVPDEYERMERCGLVRCEFGRSDPVAPTLRERMITLTNVGKEVCNNLGTVRMPAYVRYSFRSALTHNV